jgi:dipeptidyl aminopeptidase/acylaminoacyl peptidase
MKIYQVTDSPAWRHVIGALLVATVLPLMSTAAVTSTAAAPPPPKGPHVAGDQLAHRHRGLLLFTRQVCDSETDPCWEVVVSDARENHAHIVAGPYPRSAWDDHFVANWAPDGRSVIFMADQSIWRVRTDGSGLRALFSPSEGTGVDDGPAFTPDGRHIIFTRCCPAVSGYALWSITANGHDLEQVTSEAVPPGVDGPSDNLPQVSPDGRDVAHHRNVVDPAMGTVGNRISVAPVHPGTSTDITAPDGQIPNWSPNGRQLVFQRTSEDGRTDVYRVRRDGTHLTRLTRDGLSLYPSYTPDGHIIFGRAHVDGGRDLYVMRADGSHSRRIKATASSELFPHLRAAVGCPAHPRHGQAQRRAYHG